MSDGNVIVDAAFDLLLLCIKVVMFKYSTQIHWALQNSDKVELKFIVSCFGLEINSSIDEILQKHILDKKLRPLQYFPNKVITFANSQSEHWQCADWELLPYPCCAISVMETLNIY